MKTTKKSKARGTQRQTRSKQSARGGRRGKTLSVLGFEMKTWIDSARILESLESSKTSEAPIDEVRVFFFAHRDEEQMRSVLEPVLLPWQLEHALKSEAETQSFAGKAGPVFLLRSVHAAHRPLSETHHGRLEKSSLARARDLTGGILASLLSWKMATLELNFFDTSLEEERGALLGLEMASYSYAENRPEAPRARRQLPELVLRRTQLAPADLRDVALLGQSVNLARHLTNLPGGDLNPKTYSDALVSLFKGQKNVTVDVWRGEKLVREGMNLLRSVGSGAKEGPCLVHIRYRPPGARKYRPYAFVGKGITFDTGGLDMKPSSAMRLMKKDMGGSAAVAALAYWAAQSRVQYPIDFYLSLAENAVDASSFRPGDVITARNGLTVEIHNTDAEGRLALADGLDVAVNAKGADEPAAVIDLATLTGAIKVALGAEIAGLFCNDDELAEMIEEAGVATGELCWRMPLFHQYKGQLKSTFADLSNAADGFGGAITAALFLQQFVGKIPWAHLDIYAWRDGAAGAWSESGGSGQSVQAMSALLTNLAAQAGGEA